MNSSRKDPTKFLTHRVERFPEHLTLPGEREEYMLNQLSNMLNVPASKLRVFSAAFEKHRASITIYNPLPKKVLV